MGLEGTLQAFSVADILQMLTLQKKTGTLTIEGREDSVTVSFLGGQIVSANSTARSLEELAGNLLVRSGKLAQEDLVRVMQVQKETQQHLSTLLARERLLRSGDLAEAFRLQVFRIVLAAFRWTEGRFRFRQGGAIDSESALAPIATESILKEAVQMLDEWPDLERKIPSRLAVYRRAPGMEGLLLVTSPQEAGDGSLVVSRREAETWKWVDGHRRVAEILERVLLSEFDAYRGLADLIDRDLIVESKLEPVAAPAPPPRRASRFPVGAASLWLLFVLIATLGAWLVPRNPWNVFFQPIQDNQEIADLFKSVSLARLSAIERAVRVYYDSSGQYPRGLSDLTASGILDPALIRDPWGRPYRYVIRPESGRFGIYGRNALGAMDLDLSFDRTLAPVSEVRPEPGSVRQREKRPGVKVLD